MVNLCCSTANRGPPLSGLSQSTSFSINSGLALKAGAATLSIIDRLDPVISPIKKLTIVRHATKMIKIPKLMMGLAKSCLAFPGQNREMKVDTGLEICNKVRGIWKCTETFFKFLEKVNKAISITSRAWIKPFAFAMSILSFASVVIKIRTLVKEIKFMRSLNQAEESGGKSGLLRSVLFGVSPVHSSACERPSAAFLSSATPDAIPSSQIAASDPSRLDESMSETPNKVLGSYRAMLNMIQERQITDKGFVKEMFNIGEDKLADALFDIEKRANEKLISEDPAEIEDGKKISENGIKCLKRWSKKNVISSALNIFSTAVIHVIATAILFFFPLVPFGMAVVCLIPIIDFVRLVHHKIGEYRFAKQVGLKRDVLDWVVF